LFQMKHRGVSLQDVAIALRPFYFAVHPDRFSRNPRIRAQNEKSLQIFNGYLNDLFPVSRSICPTSIRFSILNNEKDGFEDVEITLSGTDPMTIVKRALESCKLPTNEIFLNESKTEGAWDSKENISSITKLALRDDINDIKWRTGAKDVVWQMDWEESHMKRCLGNLKRLLNQATPVTKQCIIQALYKNILRFGRGSFVCCDGTIQLGADNVPEQWEQVCIDFSVKRSYLPKLGDAVAELRRLLAGAVVIVPPHYGLPQTLQQITSLTARLVNPLLVVTSYDELAVGRDGRLLIPCNVDILLLCGFLKDSAEASRLVELEINRADCESHLKLSSLEWELGMRPEQILQCIHRLRSLDDKVRESLRGLGVKLSHNPNVYVMSDGKISIPLNWI
uniref:T-cell activation inhibitor, mitochondrial n=1 Tax=Angiostrongylus cantonensis TaxID=6313 RepID=A0A0K0D3J1_ANGCA